MNAVEKHPMRQQIIDGILAGATLRSIAATVEPPLHHATLARYRVKLLGTATRTMRGGNTESISLQRLADSHNVGPNGLEGLQALAKAELQQSIQNLEKDFQQWIGNAAQPDSEGQLRHRALSSHSRNLLSSFELRAKLAGLLQDGSQNGPSVNIAVLFSEAPAIQAADVIDVGATRR